MSSSTPEVTEGISKDDKHIFVKTYLILFKTSYFEDGLLPNEDVLNVKNHNILKSGMFTFPDLEKYWKLIHR